MQYSFAWPDDCEIPPPLSLGSLRRRIEVSKKAQDMNIDGLTVTYAYCSQRGYYPSYPDKENQDTYDIRKVGDYQFFGVFDGHGPVGEKCAWFARDHISKLLEEKLAQGVELADALTEAHVETNDQLAKDRSIDDQQSGTTAISVSMQGRAICIANVGDSRAMLGTLKGDKIVGKALSLDQTPYRRDERERVKLSGARVMTADQLDGIEPYHEYWDVKLGEEIDDDGDPPRIWSPDGDYPGTAFTRSIGDRIANELGVFAEPEIHRHEIGDADRVLLIASDGIFEFITTQKLMDIISLYDDPVESCRAICAEAYRLWLSREERSDDITCIILRFNPSGDGASGTGGDGGGGSEAVLGAEPPAESASEIEIDVEDKAGTLKNGGGEKKARGPRRGSLGVNDPVGKK